ncbi:MAG TPA: glycosyltransferase family 1 protein [Anaerolineaceae bacterium]|nr:MAG: Putative glycosyltransferase [Anaerolineaceae bacterium 46_22]HAF49006.1 glycosyltransferase family 1 protein [Anaerolineaceae bacterium]
MKMRILIVLTYYNPYKSGLTIYAVRQAQALAAMGHDVTVLTSQYERNLPTNELMKDVRIIRLPVTFRLSKGVIMPGILSTAWKLIAESDLVNLHLPQGDAALVAILAKIRNKPLVSTYHCDIKMPAGLINKLAGWGASLSNHISASLSDSLVQNTRDFAENSRFLKRYLNKLTVIQPPIVVDPVSENEKTQFVRKFEIDPSSKIIGMVARLASEKGVEYLVDALPEVLKDVDNAQVIFVGNYQNVIGEQAYKDKVLPMIERLGDRWKFLGVISEVEKAAFFNLCDVLVLPSINSTESFGMVQVEAMTCGTPVVATDLPGVRQPVLFSGMGKIVPVKDSHALAKGILDILKSSVRFNGEKLNALKEHYSPERVAKAYETLYQKLMGPNG